MFENFFWKVRVYYEDTDAAGIVFYANYLRYMERARTEWLRSMGFEHQTLIEKCGILFAVKKVTIDYIKPARLDDSLTITSQLIAKRRTSLVFQQNINNENGDVLSQAEVKVVCLDSTTLKVSSIPDALLLELKKLTSYPSRGKIPLM